MSPIMREADGEHPIIIVSVGRSGSTLLHDVLSHHPHVAWLSDLAGARPERPGLQRLLLHAVDLPLIGRGIRRHWGPAEAYDFWERYARGFKRPFRSLRADDVTPRARQDVVGALRAIRTARRRRLLLKITGWSRVEYLKCLFPTARFLHIVRDGRAVASSVLQTSWWLGWHGPGAWRFGALSPEDHREWQRHERSFVVLAALQWRFVLRSIEDALATLPESDHRTLRYEDLCAAPTEVLRDVASFSGLHWDRRLERVVRARNFHDFNDKFRRDLSATQVRQMEEVLGPELTRHGYA